MMSRRSSTVLYVVGFTRYRGAVSDPVVRQVAATAQLQGTARNPGVARFGLGHQSTRHHPVEAASDGQRVFGLAHLVDGAVQLLKLCVGVADALYGTSPINKRRSITVVM
jgi:hypothetical protein